VEGTLSFQPLPPDAASVILFRADGEQLLKIDAAGGDTPFVRDASDVAWVQVNNINGDPIRLGFPRPVPAGAYERPTGAARRSTTRSGRAGTT
jgi:hypothetical protein